MYIFLFQQVEDIEVTVFEKILRICLYALNFQGLTQMSFRSRLSLKWWSLKTVYCFFLITFHVTTIVTESFVILQSMAGSEETAGKKMLRSFNLMAKSIQHIAVFILFARGFHHLRRLVQTRAELEHHHQHRFGPDSKWKKRVVTVASILIFLRIIAYGLGKTMTFIFAKLTPFDIYLHNNITVTIFNILFKTK